MDSDPSIEYRTKISFLLFMALYDHTGQILTLLEQQYDEVCGPSDHDFTCHVLYSVYDISTDTPSQGTLLSQITDNPHMRSRLGLLTCSHCLLINSHPVTAFFLQKCG